MRSLMTLVWMMIGCEEGAPPPIANEAPMKNSHGDDHSKQAHGDAGHHDGGHGGEEAPIDLASVEVAPTEPMTINARLIQPPDVHDPAPAAFEIEWETTTGTFVMKCVRAWSPNGADRLHFLVKEGYFSDVAFYRVVPGFMAQFGYHGKPPLNKVWRDHKIKDDPVTQQNTRGMVSFATSGPNTRTTQLFINYGDNRRLDKMGFSPVCIVDDAGMMVVDQIDASHGEAPNQRLIAEVGNGYLKKNFPNLDYIQKARIRE
ncbi:MAG: peptidylprolyl isomerase [Myxococcota bacterium]